MEYLDLYLQECLYHVPRHLLPYVIYLQYLSWKDARSNRRYHHSDFLTEKGNRPLPAKMEGTRFKAHLESQVVSPDLATIESSVMQTDQAGPNRYVVDIMAHAHNGYRAGPQLATTEPRSWAKERIVVWEEGVLGPGDSLSQ